MLCPYASMYPKIHLIGLDDSVMSDLSLIIFVLLKEASEFWVVDYELG